MPNIDPKVKFWVGFAVTIFIGVSQGTLVLTNAVPADLLPYVTAWSSILAFVGSALLTALNGAASTTSSRIASAAKVDGVEGLTVTPKLTEVARQAADGNATITTK